MKKSISLKLFLSALVVVMLSACSKDDEPKIPKDIPIWVAYKLDVATDASGNASYNAYASFRSYAANGQLLKLNNGADILINGKGMTYFHSEESSTGWDYFRQINSESVADYIVFNFIRGNGTEVKTSINVNNIAKTPIPEEFRNIYRGQVIKVPVDMMLPYSYSLFVSHRTSTGSTTYECENLGMGTFRVPESAPVSSTCSLILYTTESRDIPMDNGVAGGVITISNAYTLSGVSISDR